MKTTQISAVTIAFFSCVLAHAQTPANPLTDFRAYTRDLSSLSGSFTQEVRDKNGRVSRQSAGTFAIARPGKFRFVYEKPYKQTIVSDGVTVWLYDEDLNQVTTKKLADTLSEQPLTLLLDPAAAEKAFELKVLESRDSIGYVEARPRKVDASVDELRIAMVASKPAELSWRDALQNTNAIRFTTLTKNGKLASDAFAFVPPKGADILKQ